ncbi:hypothetical protein CHS0354_010975 [Potamilus streckersoni]|uniref:Uncharacterized protein n=1 Tax=Potamilus streckersoni TaxID=2493646 RepID=A0AAE0VI69_9BIVA|nr:hypothetical protein CHS0354_010975 [Potamilus streckersoni]
MVFIVPQSQANFEENGVHRAPTKAILGKMVFIVPQTQANFDENGVHRPQTKANFEENGVHGAPTQAYFEKNVPQTHANYDPNCTKIQDEKAGSYRLGTVDFEDSGVKKEIGTTYWITIPRGIRYVNTNASLSIKVSENGSSGLEPISLVAYGNSKRNRRNTNGVRNT